MILDMVKEWFRELLIDGIIGNLSGMFDTVSTKMGEIAGEIGMTPSAWNGSVFSMAQSLSKAVVLPIVGIILTFVMCYELIQIVIEKDNPHDIDTWIFFKWIFRTICAVSLVTNTWNIVMGISGLTRHVVNQSAEVIISDMSVNITSTIVGLETRLTDWSIGSLLELWSQSIFVGLTMNILSVCIFLVIYGRMIEIYLVASIEPIPLAAMVNRGWGGMRQGYLKSLFALGFQAFLIMVYVGIYVVLVQTIAVDDDMTGATWACVGYTVLLCYTLFKTSSLARSLFVTH